MHTKMNERFDTKHLFTVWFELELDKVHSLYFSFLIMVCTLQYKRNCFLN